MSRLWDWPALEGAAGGLPAGLTVERAIWGKVHGARSDFRWIAATRGFASLGPDLERELAVGIEDRPVRFPLWRAAPGVHLAGTCYPSRARDAAGRSGVLEKHVLAWRSDPAVPAALAALLLLPHAAGLDDGAWWGRADPAVWDADSRFVLDLGNPREIPLSEWSLEEAVAAGLHGLRAALAPGGDETALAGLFTGLLEGRRPLFFPAADGPLAPRDLAVLLLPLERSSADRLSIAGWLPSSRPPRAETARQWDLVFHAGGSPAGGPAAADPRAGRMAAALLAGDPSVLPRARPAGHFVGAPRAGTASAPDPGDDAVRPEAAARQEEPAAGRPALPRPPALPEPPPGADAGWRVLYDLARDPFRFWLDPRELPLSADDAPEEEGGGALDAALIWLRALGANRLPGPAGEQLDAKGDLLRAAILALAPSPSTLDAVGPFRGHRVPPLLYVTALSSEGWGRVRRRLGGELADELIRRSREWCAPELRPRLEGWLECAAEKVSADGEPVSGSSGEGDRAPWSWGSVRSRRR